MRHAEEYGYTAWDISDIPKGASMHLAHPYHKIAAAFPTVVHCEGSSEPYLGL